MSSMAEYLIPSFLVGFNVWVYMRLKERPVINDEKGKISPQKRHEKFLKKHKR